MHPKYYALFSSVNLLLGTGPIILPLPFFNAGVLISIFWMIIICFLSYQSAMFIVESMFILRQYRQKPEEIELISMKQKLCDKDTGDSQKDSGKSEQNQKNEKIHLDHISQFEIIFDKKGGVFICIAISLYLFGAATSQCILTGKIMSKIFCEKENQSLSFMGNFNFWIFVFFLSGAAFSFKSISHTIGLQASIAGIRCFSIILFIFGTIYLMFKDGIQDMTPIEGGVYNLQEFGQLFSTSILAFIFHHSLPNIVSNLNNKEDVQFVVKNGLKIAGLVLLTIPITGVMAFGGNLTNAKFYNLVFEGRIKFIYLITSFYVFLSVGAFSIYIIVIRKNIMHIFRPEICSMKLSKQTVRISIIILSCILFISWQFQNQIQFVFDFTGGVFGIVILFLIPSICVYKARILAEKQVIGKFNQWLPIFIGILGLVFLSINLCRIILD